MNRNRLLGIGLTFLIIAFIFIQPAYVGPGGKIAKTMLSSFWGLLFFIGFTVTCLPLSIYQFVCGKREEKRMLDNLRKQKI
jgi:protein-S-isoprenylcysteine O-methyltransferase Ste14